jgi:Fe-S cluster biogenesis protein NfuA
MMIEQQALSTTETLLYFKPALSLMGAFYATPKTAELPLFEDIFADVDGEEALLTADFLYLKAKDSATLEDLTALSLALLEEADLQNIPLPKTHTVEKATIILKNIVAPLLKKDKGDIALESIENGVLKVRFLGKCNGCPYAERTLKNHVEKNIIRYLPEIREVILA